ncbi:DUF6221 family protein [Streptomyces prunicolor]|uniref:DUF6221 family protein n=1 Tax=Streptomyces prunicolor TaxID=67348 RepID=UPI00131A05EC|nr:DUF6221 family protein [Streptomyces prunicolor]
MTGTDRMVSWLRETLAAAQADAEGATPGPWHVTDYPYGYDFAAVIGTRPLDCDVVAGSHDNGGGVRLADARHIARNSPAAVLLRIAADRKQHDEHIPVPDHGRFSHSYGEKCPAFCEGECRDSPKVCLTCRDSSGDPIEAPCRSLKFLAEAWDWTEETPEPQE